MKKPSISTIKLSKKAVKQSRKSAIDYANEVSVVIDRLLEKDELDAADFLEDYYDWHLMPELETFYEFSEKELKKLLSPSRNPSHQNEDVWLDFWKNLTTEEKEEIEGTK